MASAATYFVAWRRHVTQADLTERERSLVVDALRFFDGQRYDLLSYVVMNDHVHVLFQPRDAWVVESLVHTWKSFTASQLQRLKLRRGSLWQDEYFDRIVRDADELEEKFNYILGIQENDGRNVVITNGCGGSE